MVDHVVVGDAVQFVGGHTGRDGLAGLGKRLGCDAAGDPHLLDDFAALNPRLAALGDLVAADVLGSLDRLGHRQGR